LKKANERSTDGNSQKYVLAVQRGADDKLRSASGVQGKVGKKKAHP